VKPRTVKPRTAKPRTAKGGNILRGILPVALVLLAACTGTWLEPVKSPNDHNDYRYIVLPNDLRALLIRVPGSVTAAAAVSVARGSEHDPDDHPGLAHFVEHMLFIATDKYPEVDGFGEFVSRHGGYTNAYTGNDRTTYYFDIDSGRLPEALDRFAQFFISPRFDPDYLEREKHAVQGEYQMQRQVDYWRGVAVHKRLVNPEHPGARFDWGSLESLRGVGVAEARAFFEANYSADTMTLAVLGHQRLDALQALVERRFGGVVNRTLGPMPINPPLYEGVALPTSYAWQTVTRTRTLSFRFPVPPVKPHYRSKPGMILASLIGHEGPGSLHQVLTSTGWIDSLVTDIYDLDDWNGTFDIDMTLTEAGSSHVDEIVDLTHAWIGLIRREGIEAWRYDEDALTNELAFRFLEPLPPFDAVVAAAEGLRDYAPEDVLRATYMMESFDEALVRSHLDHLTPENSVVSVSGPDIEGDSVEPFFGASWRRGPGLMPREAEAPFALPQPNPYLPEDLDLAFEPAVAEPPVALDTGTAVETWHAADTEFGIPWGYVGLDLRAAEAFGADDVVLSTLHGRLAKAALNPRTYFAWLAGVFSGMEATPTGFRIAVRGFDDKLGVLFDEVLAAFVDTPIDERRFAVLRGELAKEYANLRLARPYEQVEDSLYRLIDPQALPVESLVDAAARATPASLAAWRRDRLEDMAATLFVHGNLRRKEARALAALVQDRLDVVARPHELPKARRVTGAARFEHDVEHDDATYLLYVQARNDSVDERARVALISRMLNARYFTALRTERQLGYVVDAYDLSIARHPGIVFVVQVSKAGVDEVESLTREFLDAQRSWFRELPADEFEEYRNGYLSLLDMVDVSNDDRVARLHADLTDRILTFDSERQLKDVVADLGAADLADAYDALIDPARGNRLTVFSRGKPGVGPDDGNRSSRSRRSSASTRRRSERVRTDGLCDRTHSAKKAAQNRVKASQCK